ncbi:MAG: rRNA maturation RNase YbeY [Clostridia bacterium]|nr:rRNA maturation RNase YbeY [Clostridia bacterium]
MRKNGHDVFITNEQDKIEVTRELKNLIVSSVAETLKYEQFEEKCEVSVTLCSNEAIHELNREYRGVDRVTDVLSFPIFDEDDMGSKVVLGDIVLSLEKALSQANEYGHSFEREVAFLCVHSMLHLLGYDHEEGKAQESEMFSRQEEILCNMGIAR